MNDQNPSKYYLNFVDNLYIKIQLYHLFPTLFSVQAVKEACVGYTGFCCLLQRPYKFVLLTLVCTSVGCCKVCRPSDKGGTMWRHCGARQRHRGTTFIIFMYFLYSYIVLVAAPLTWPSDLTTANISEHNIKQNKLVRSVEHTRFLYSLLGFLNCTYC